MAASEGIVEPGAPTGSRTAATGDPIPRVDRSVEDGPDADGTAWTATVEGNGPTDVRLSGSIARSIRR